MAGSQQPGMRARAAGLAHSIKAVPDRMPLIRRALHQIVRVNLLDCATRLAAQAFLSALPALMVLAVFAPAAVKEGVVSSLRDQLGLKGAAQQQVAAFLTTGHDDEVSQSFGAAGVIITLLSATTLSRAVQRVCERCWDLPRASGRITAWRWLLWLLVWLVVLVFQHALHDGFGAGLWLGIPLTFLLDTVLWWWTQHLLLAARVPWRPLLPGALLCGVAVVGVNAAAAVYLPRAVTQSVERFGPYGVVFTLLSWLIVMFTAVTFAIALGRVLSQEPAVAQLLGTPLHGAGGEAAAGTATTGTAGRPGEDARPDEDGGPPTASGAPGPPDEVDGADGPSGEPPGRVGGPAAG
ncbi:YhjD/YihY/BrkB family envelope integrity protein [Kitasatospora sp. NPDC051914]|uniref:YhjD/YihY/BrkB family envelope integrity protein n=1 Tax=Kitasatospora sp. NPDC051914 TaxID=3154945 RepID=UPI003437BB7C